MDRGLTGLEYLVLLVLVFTGAWLGIWFGGLVRQEQEARIRIIYEGTSEWVAVKNIENENIILKKNLDDMRAHYDSMVCYRPAKVQR